MKEGINYDSDLWPEINIILKNNKVVKSEVDFLEMIFEENQDNKEILKNTQRKDLLKLKNALKTVYYANSIKKRIDSILWVENRVTKSKERKIYRLKKNLKEKNNIEENVNTQKHYNYDLKSLSWHPRFRWSRWKIERKALLGSKRDKVYASIDKYISFLSWKEKETFTNILFFESVYWKYKDNRWQNRNWTVDIWPCAINNWDTYKELKKAWIVTKQSDLYDWDTSFKSAAYLMKRHWVRGFRKWYWRLEAKKANLYA